MKAKQRPTQCRQAETRMRSGLSNAGLGGVQFGIDIPSFVNCRDGSALLRRLSRCPAAWSALTRRLGDQGDDFTPITTTSQTRQCPFAYFKTLSSLRA